jgi:hypothetical protein
MFSLFLVNNSFFTVTSTDHIKSYPNFIKFGKCVYQEILERIKKNILFIIMYINTMLNACTCIYEAIFLIA